MPNLKSRFQNKLVIGKINLLPSIKISGVKFFWTNHFFSCTSLLFTIITVARSFSSSCHKSQEVVLEVFQELIALLMALCAKSCISEYWTKGNILGRFGQQMSGQPMIFPFVQYSLIFNIHLYMIWHKMQYYLIRFFFKRKSFVPQFKGNEYDTPRNLNIITKASAVKLFN